MTLPVITRNGSSVRTRTSWWTSPNKQALNMLPESRGRSPSHIYVPIYFCANSIKWNCGDILQKFCEFSNKFYPVKILVNWISLLSKRGPRARLLTNPKIRSNFPLNHFKQLRKLPLSIVWQVVKNVPVVVCKIILKFLTTCYGICLLSSQIKMLTWKCAFLGFNFTFQSLI